MLAKLIIGYKKMISYRVAETKAIQGRGKYWVVQYTAKPLTFWKTISSIQKSKALCKKLIKHLKQASVQEQQRYLLLM